MHASARSHSELPQPGATTGDILIFDWVPGTGTQVFTNGTQVGQAIPDVAFFNALLKVWLGNREIDRTLKTKLLGAKP